MTAAPAKISLIAENEEPIWGELFSVERLEQHAETLAAAQTVTTHSDAGKPLLPRVVENGRLLFEYYGAIVRSVQGQQIITPAAQWLVDNFFVVEEQVREIRDDLPAGFYKELPKIASGHLAGYPRVYGVAWAYIAHTDSRFDPDVLYRYINAYQRVQPLNTGELWAIPITLRIVLVENLRRLAAHISSSRDARSEADALADGLLGVGGKPAALPATVLRQFEKKPLDRALVVQLLQRLRDLDPRVAPILLWLDERLSAQGTTPDEMVRAEHQYQAATTVTVRNIITSMRLTSEFDWHGFFERVSLTDQILRSDSNFGDLDFVTRDAYQHAIEDLSRRSGLSEFHVAQRVLQFARDANAGKEVNQPPGATRDPRFSDPGYYLISQGHVEFERSIGYRLSWKRWLTRQYVRHAVPGYLGTIALLSLIILGLPLLRSWQFGAGIAQLVLLALVAAVPASDLAISLINRMVTESLGPRNLPRLEL